MPVHWFVSAAGSECILETQTPFGFQVRPYLLVHIMLKWLADLPC